MMRDDTGCDVHGSGGDGRYLKEDPVKGDPTANRKGAKGSAESSVIDLRQEGAEDQGAVDKDGKEEGRGRDGERMCRICHLGDEESQQPGQGTLFHLGCGCTDSLGFAHHPCAEAWFITRGRKDCEICGLDAKNVTGVADWNFIVEWNEERACPEDAMAPVPMWSRQPFWCIILLLVIICVVLLGIFRVGI